MDDQAGRDFEGALASLAPCAYARVFAASGSFQAAQEALERALAAAFPTYDDLRRVVGRDDACRTLVPVVARLAVARLSTREPEGPPSSFSRVPRLRAQEEVLAIVRSFSETEQAAIVLIHVEEVPDASVREWLGVDAPFLEDLRARISERAGALVPPSAADAGGKELFERTLRRHRLPASLPQSVMARVRASGPAASAAPSPALAAWVVPLLLLGFCLISASFPGSRRNALGDAWGYGQYGGGYRSAMLTFLASSLETYVLEVALVLLWRHLGRLSSAAAASAGRLRAASICLATIGAPFILLALSPMTAEMVATAFPNLEVLVLAHNLWRLGSVACLGVGLSWIFLRSGEAKEP